MSDTFDPLVLSDDAPTPKAPRRRRPKVATVTYLITGESAKYGGECIVCHQWVDPKRHWEAILLRLRGAKKGGHAVGHAGCLGGKFGGVQKSWRGPSEITVPGGPTSDNQR